MYTNIDIETRANRASRHEIRFTLKSITLDRDQTISLHISLRGSEEAASERASYYRKIWS